MPPRAKSAAVSQESSGINQPLSAVVSRQYQTAGEPPEAPEVKNETLEVQQFVTEPAKVSVAMGLTLNLGNYETARIDVSMLVPCYREEADAAYKYAHGWVEGRLAAEVEDIRSKKPSIF